MNTNLSYAVLVFALIVVLFQMWLLYKSQVIASDKGVHHVGVTLVVTAILFMLAGGMPEHTTTPVVGLLGTIIGYVAGSSPLTKPKANNKAKTETTPKD